MSDNTKNTALLVFSLSAEIEAKRKPLFGTNNSSVSKDFFELLIKQTQNIARSSGVDVFWLDEKKQRGATFAQRYTNAFQDIFAQGYTKVISIGNDSPDLSATKIKQALSRLDDTDIVMGPSKDGGAYLIGINKNVFDPKVFQSLPWETPNLFHELLAACNTYGKSYFSLESLTDIDDLKSAAEYAAHSPMSIVAKFVQKYFSTEKFGIQYFAEPFTACCPVSSFGLRGPPIITSFR